MLTAECMLCGKVGKGKSGQRSKVHKRTKWTKEQSGQKSKVGIGKSGQGIKMIPSVSFMIVCSLQLAKPAKGTSWGVQRAVNCSVTLSHQKSSDDDDDDDDYDDDDDDENQSDGDDDGHWKDYTTTGRTLYQRLSDRFFVFSTRMPCSQFRCTRWWGVELFVYLFMKYSAKY